VASPGHAATRLEVGRLRAIYACAYVHDVSATLGGPHWLGRVRDPKGWVPLLLAAAIGFAAASFALPAAAVASSAPADQWHVVGHPVQLPGSAWQVLVDQKDKEVFVSCPDSGTVSVFNFGAKLIKNIKGISGAEGMAVNGSTLYVVRNNNVTPGPTTGEIDSIDTTTLTDTGSLATGLSNPQAVVYADGSLWVGNGASLSSVAVSTGVVTTYSGGYFGDLDPLGLRGDPANSDLLFDFGRADPTEVSTVDLSTTPPTVARPTSLYKSSSALSGALDAVMSPSGTNYLLVAHDPYKFALGAATPTTVYQISVSTLATAVADTQTRGGLVAVGLQAATNGPQIDIDSRATGSIVDGIGTSTYDGEEVLPRCIDFDASGNTLYAVTGSDVNPPDNFIVFSSK